MKIVLLDFDGVINTYSSIYGIDATGINFSKACIKNLNDLLNKEKDVKIVVSSSWRMHGLERMKEILKHNGVDPKRIVDITGHEMGSRGYQIQCWLDRNPKVTNIVILDDYADMDNLSDRLVQTNPFVGLTSKDVEKAIDILSKPVYSDKDSRKRKGYDK